MKTPFYEMHKSLNAKLVDFHGWIMPLQYSTGIINEHMSVRKRAGLFDVSHMGRFEIKGPNSLELLQNLLTNDVSKLQDNQALYSPMCYDSGGIVDDLIIYMINRERFLVVVNSSNRKKDFRWIVEHSNEKKSSPSVNMEDVTERMALLALQGPLAQNVLQKEVMDINFDLLKPFYLVNAKLFGVECIISRTGYTGEDGFEIFFDSSEIQVWDKLLQVDSKFDVRPAGLGARDSLRLEAGFMLYGNDIDENITPLEAPLAWTVKLDKEQDFIGKQALRTNRATRKKKLVGFEILQSKRIARRGSEVFLAGLKAGYVTSGGFSPTLNKSIGFCFVPSELAFDQIVDMNITRGEVRQEGEHNMLGTDKKTTLYPAKIGSTRFYKRNK